MYRNKHTLYSYIPGASELPAKKLPIITVEAPSAKALTICPEFEIPPSAIIGIPLFSAILATL